MRIIMNPKPIIDVHCDNCNTKVMFTIEKENNLMTFLCYNCNTKSKYYKFPNLDNDIPRAHIFIHEQDIDSIIYYLKQIKKWLGTVTNNNQAILIYAKRIMPNLHPEIELLIKLDAL